jgi:NTP pyrophosphatase (non-canonical NTP hydrolase)
MQLNEYQKKARETAHYPRQEGREWIYPALGLAGEAGEVADKIKKVLRDHDGIVSDDRREALKKELGDVLWYVAQLSTELNIELDDVAQTNLEKLFSRMERGVISGDGDNR